MVKGLVYGFLLAAVFWVAVAVTFIFLLNYSSTHIRNLLERNITHAWI